MNAYEEWKPIIDAFAEVVVAEKAVIDVFRRLEQEVVVALDLCKQPSTERNADTRKPGRVALPGNPDVMRLARKINDEIDSETSQTDIAIQFTKGDKRKTQSLLRQLRRFPHLRAAPGK